MNETDIKKIKPKFFNQKGGTKEKEPTLLLSVEIKFKDCNCIDNYRTQINDILDNIGIPFEHDQLRIVGTSNNSRSIEIDL